MKKLLILLLGVLAVFGLASCSNSNSSETQSDSTTTASSSARGTLVVGMECTYQPFNWTETVATDTNVPISNLSGSYAEGYDVQIARRIATALDMNLEVKQLVWDALIPSLENNQIDMIIAGMSVTAARLEKIDFTDGYYKSAEVMVVSKDSQYANATSLADFSGATVAAQTGTVFADLVSQVVAVGATQGNNESNVSGIIRDIHAGVTDATILEEPAALGVIAGDPSLAMVTFADGQGFNVSEADITVNVGVKKGYDLTAQINTVLAGISSADRLALMTNAVKMYAAQN